MGEERRKECERKDEMWRRKEEEEKYSRTEKRGAAYRAMTAQDRSSAFRAVSSSPPSAIDTTRRLSSARFVESAAASRRARAT